MPDPRRDEKSLRALVRYLAKAKSLDQIQQKFRLSERTAYRWLDYLRQDGHKIATLKGARAQLFEVRGG